MEHLNITGIGLKGLNTDLAPWELPPEIITVGRNFRTDNNKLISTGAHEDLTTGAVDIDAGLVIPIVATSGDFWLIAGRPDGAGDNTIQVYNGASWADISRGTGLYSSIIPGAELNWTSCMIGKIPILNNPNHTAEYWDPQSPATLMQLLPFDASSTWLSKTYKCDVMRSHKNYLFAMSLTEGAIELPHAYRWSHPADNNAIPVSWDETDLSYIAGRAQLGGDSGRIIDGRTLRDSFCMYSEFGVNVLDESYDEFIFKRKVLSTAFGLISRNCIVDIKGVHYFIGDGDIVTNDGNRLDSLIHGRLRSRLTSQMSGDYYHRSFAVRNTAKKELWFCVPEAGAQFPNIAYVYNWKEGSWSIHDIPYTEDGTGSVTLGISSAQYGPQSDPPTTYDVLTAPTDTYDLTTLSYGSQINSPLNSTVVAIDNLTADLIVLDPANPTATSDTDFYIERTDVVIAGVEYEKTITRVYPLCDGTDPISIQIGSQQFAGGPVNWETAIIYDPVTDRKIDIRSSGKLHAYRVKSISTGRVSISGFNFEYEINGKR